MIQILAKNVENNIFTCTQTIFNNTGHLLILEVTRKFRFNFYHSFQITTKQCIVNLASARTVHKAQCWTLSGAVIHLGYQKIEHMHHIALSEVKKLSLNYLFNFCDANINVSGAVEKENAKVAFFNTSMWKRGTYQLRQLIDKPTTDN